MTQIDLQSRIRKSPGTAVGLAAGLAIGIATGSIILWLIIGFLGGMAWDRHKARR